ncbi:MAG: hypothetical protein WC959_10085 [Kiritimatiellales bacterium]
MNRWFKVLIFYGATCSLISQAAPVRVRLQTTAGNLSGALESRAGSMIVFTPSVGAESMQLPAAQITAIQFPVGKTDEEDIALLLNDGNYYNAEEILSKRMADWRPYFDLPSNAGQQIAQWLAVSYWIGEYDRALEFAAALLKQSGDLKNAAQFYSLLITLEKGGYESIDVFLKTPEGNALFPEESAARLYMDARIQQYHKEYTSAIRTAALLMAIHSADADWVPKTELLCAELYFQLNMPESAQAVLADIKEFYSDPHIQKRAAEIAKKK